MKLCAMLVFANKQNTVLLDVYTVVKLVSNVFLQ